MSDQVTSAWVTLGMEPTTDVNQLRHAYRARLKVVNPESDPTGFQALRQAYEILLGDLQHPAQPQSTKGGSMAAQAFVDQLQAHRRVGDVVGAMAFADKSLAAQQPGSAKLQAIEEALMDQVAFDRQLSSLLFLQMVNWFDWRDIQGRIARQNPECHAALLDRIGAEDWFTELQTSASQPDGQVDALMLAKYDGALAMLTATGLKPGSATKVRQRVDEMLTHASFVLNRFDGATLALVREAVEGPPLLGDSKSVLASSTPDTAEAATAVPTLSKKNEWRVKVAVAAIVVLILSGQFWWKSSKKQNGSSLPDTSLAYETAAPLLRDPSKPWLATRPEPAGIYVDWAPIMKMRQAVADLRIGVNVDEPATAMQLPQWDAPIGFVATKDIQYITMRLRYKADGQWSEVHRYPIWEGKP